MNFTHEVKESLIINMVYSINACLSACVFVSLCDLCVSYMFCLTSIVIMMCDY